MTGGKTYVKVTLGEDWANPKRTLKVTIDDVARYYRYEAPNISSGCRTLAGETGDWRMIDYIAQDCLQYFKEANIEGMRKAGRKYGMEPKF